MRDISPEPITALESTLSLLGRRYATTEGRLTNVERMMALTAGAQALRDSFGPGFEQMTATAPKLPEDIKGLLADYAS